MTLLLATSPYGALTNVSLICLQSASWLCSFLSLFVLFYFWLFPTYSTRSILPTCAPWFYLFPSNHSQCQHKSLPAYCLAVLWVSLSPLRLPHSSNQAQIFSVLCWPLPLESSYRFLTVSSIHPLFHPFTHSSMNLCIHLFIHPVFTVHLSWVGHCPSQKITTVSKKRPGPCPLPMKLAAWQGKDTVIQ